MVLGKLPVPGRPTFWMIVGQGPHALAVGSGGFFWETARYRLKYCLKGPLNPKQPTTNQQSLILHMFFIFEDSSLYSSGENCDTN